MRAFLSNYEHASPFGYGAVTAGGDGPVSAVTNAPTNHPWFRRFLAGCHKRMGDVWKPDEPLTRGIMHACFATLEDDWRNILDGDVLRQVFVSETACMLIAGYFAALRGEEIVKVDLGAMNQHWEEATGYDGCSHVPLMLAAKLKGTNGTKLHTQPLAPVTKDGRNLQVWFQRALTSTRKAGRTEGPFFRNRKGARASVGDLDERLRPLLARVHARYPNVLRDPDTIPSYSMSRSGRRGATLEAGNVQIPQRIVDDNNRWRKWQRAQGRTPSFTMAERYSQAKATAMSLVLFSYCMPSQRA